MTRSGTASTKTRYEVRGSARKVRPQKGGGTARLGDKKSPMLRGGGVAFGPKPRDFATKLQKKVYDLAWRTALSYRYRKGELIIVDNAIEIESPSTRLLDDVFRYHEKLRGKGRSLLVTTEARPLLQRALADMDRGGQALTWEEIDVKNLLELSRIIIERDALHNILFSHQEDLTHKSVSPRDQKLIVSLPPEELESRVGWREFRSLTLLNTKEQDAARIEAYESTATTRYTFANSLENGPERTEVTVSAYNLLANAKKLQFQQKTSLSFEAYAELNDDSEKPVDPSVFPRIQALTFQINLKDEIARKTGDGSRQKGEYQMEEVYELQVERAEVRYEAAILAAQIYEHVAESQLLSGDLQSNEQSLASASAERTNVDMLELDALEAKSELAKQRLVVAVFRKDMSARSRAESEIVSLSDQIATKNAEIEALQQSVEEEDGANDDSMEAIVPAENEEKQKKI